MALYSTYRPQTFADVVGQDHIVTTLERAALQNRLAHAYLFAGSRGTGKTSVARILAKVLMIQGIEDETRVQQILRGVEDGSIVDLLEIDAASNNGVDDVRELIEKLQFSPVIAAKKVYIIDEVHMLSKGAFNALLKTLEEPPDYAHFILATTEITKIPTTIQSRCQCFPFRHIGEEDIVRRLQYIADQEHIVIDREALRAIARHVGGGLRDAISLLDQLRSLQKITVKDVQERIGAVGHEEIEAIATALREGDAPSLMESVRRVEEAGVPLDIFLRHLLQMTRADLHRAVEENGDTEEILRALAVLLEAIRDVRIAPVPGLVVESALLKLIADKGEKKKFLLFKATDAPKEPAREPKKEVQTKPEPKDGENEPEKPSAVIEAPELSMRSLRESWNDIVGAVTPPSVKMSLKDGEVSDLRDGKVIVEFASAFHRDKVAALESSRIIEQVLQKHFKRALKLECRLGEVPQKMPAKADEEVNLAEAAKEIF